MQSLVIVRKLLKSESLV